MLPPDSLFTLNNPSVGQINALCFHHDERLFAATQKGQVFIFDLQVTENHILSYFVSEILQFVFFRPIVPHIICTLATIH